MCFINEIINGTENALHKICKENKGGNYKKVKHV